MPRTCQLPNEGWAATTFVLDSRNSYTANRFKLKLSCTSSFFDCTKQTSGASRFAVRNMLSFVHERICLGNIDVCFLAFLSKATLVF